MAEKTADQIAEDAIKAVEDEEAKAAAGGGGNEEETPKPKDETAEDDFGDDDLDPEKIEAGLADKKTALDNAGILKRFKKVHASLKEHKTWRSEREPKLTVYEKQAQAVDRMLAGLAKHRSKESPDQQTPLEDLLEALLDEKGTPNWPAAKEFIEKIMGGVASAEAPKAGETAEAKQMREDIAKLKAEREAEKTERIIQEAQGKLDQKVAKAFSEIPTELNKLPEFKGLPWKNKEWKKEFDDDMDDKILAWSSRNEEKLNKGEFPPVLELAKQVAKSYLRGGSDVLKKQVEGGKPGGLNRGNGPSGSQPRQLPKPNDREDDARYLEELAEAIGE